MSNELLALTSANAKITPVQALILAEMEDEAHAFEMQPARVKIAPGGIGQFMLGDEAAKTFTAIVPISQIVRGYWAASGTGSAPICSSPNGVQGFFSPEPSDADFAAAQIPNPPHPAIRLISQGVPLPDSFACASGPMNAWGSEYQKKGRGGRGRACKEMRRLMLFIDGWALPAIFALPPTSIRTWDNYCSSARARRSAYFGVRTKFELDTAKAASGESYNTVKVSMAGELTEMEMQNVVGLRQQYMDLVRNIPIQDADYEAGPTVHGPSEDEALPPM
jgi:hypothetical protein